MEHSLDTRDYSEFHHAIALAEHTVYKRYLSELWKYPLAEPEDRLLDESADDCLRFFRLEELSCRHGEDIFQKLSTVYHASMSLGCNLIVMVDVERIDAPAKIYLGVRNGGYEEEKKKLSTSFQTLKNGMQGNFPGTKLHNVPSKEELPDMVEDIFGKEAKYIASVSCVAASRDKSKTEDKAFIQGIERFIDTMRGNAYTAVLIAEPMEEAGQTLLRRSYEELYSSLSIFQKSTLSYNENESKAVSESIGSSISRAITKGSSHTASHTAGDTEGSADSFGTSRGTSFGVNAGVHAGGKIIGANFEVSAGVNFGESRTRSDSRSHTNSNTAAYTETDSRTKTETDTKTNGTTDTKGTGRTFQFEMVNKSVEEMLERIKEQLKRIKESEDYGAYKCGAYFISAKRESALLAANTYRALMIGEGSSVESGAINLWNGQEDPHKIQTMKEYLRRFVHPVFHMPVLKPEKNEESFIPYTPGTLVSGLELPLHLGLPTKSVHGLPVIEHAEFGRNVTEDAPVSGSYRKIKLGSIYHMGQTEKESPVELSLPGLASHTFITGSTGSGKSNTLYQMLDHICFGQDKDETAVHFLVIEPAKGEYKGIFGGREDVSVYGTNPGKSRLLRINPFSFPEDIHVLEHIDRLIEIFNVCWPMYAAMPAVLKEAVERAYVTAGWDLELSRCKNQICGNYTYPSFLDVLKQINCVINETKYSADSKGDYAGALTMRIGSLTNGINGQILTDDALSDQELFDKNVIIDLSRVGSSETKSLLMGLLVMKLQEYRMACATGSNRVLSHITVLEEAHNLLKRTSTEQSAEGSNLLGKSVEMLANAIAEMRTYGEGFIIADQSPGLMDLSVIRNTNTKIILRLPDQSDRELVGKAANLNEEQIQEIAKLKTGVCAVYQNNWVEPVLCQVMQWEESKNRPYEKETEPVFATAELKKELLGILLAPAGSVKEMDTRHFLKELKKIRISTELKLKIKEFTEEKNVDKIRAFRESVIYEIFSPDALIDKNLCYRNEIQEWKRVMVEELLPDISCFGETEKNKILSILAVEKMRTGNRPEYEELLDNFLNYVKSGKGAVL